MHIVKCAMGGAAFASSAVIAAAITWTLVQSHRDRQHMVEYWQRRRCDEARSRALPAPRLGVLR